MIVFLFVILLVLVLVVVIVLVLPVVPVVLAAAVVAVHACLLFCWPCMSLFAYCYTGSVACFWHPVQLQQAINNNDNLEE